MTALRLRRGSYTRPPSRALQAAVCSWLAACHAPTGAATPGTSVATELVSAPTPNQPTASAPATSTVPRSARVVGLTGDDGGWWLVLEQGVTPTDQQLTRQRVDARGVYTIEAQSAVAAHSSMGSPAVVVGAGGGWSDVAYDPVKQAWVVSAGTLGKADTRSVAELGTTLDNATAFALAITTPPGQRVGGGTLVWWQHHQVAAHRRLGPDRSAWIVVEQRVRAMATVFDNGKVRTLELSAWRDTLERNAGSIAVVGAGSRLAAVFVEPHNEGMQLRASWLGKGGKVLQSGAQPLPEEFADIPSAVLLEDGSLFGFATTRSSLTSRMGVVGFDARGKALPAQLLAEPFAHDETSVGFACAGRPWFLYTRAGSTPGAVEIRALGLADDGKLQAPTTLETVTLAGFVPGQRIDGELQLAGACHDGHAGYAAVVVDPTAFADSRVVFGTWTP